MKTLIMQFLNHPFIFQYEAQCSLMAQFWKESFGLSSLAEACVAE